MLQITTFGLILLSCIVLAIALFVSVFTIKWTEYLLDQHNVTARVLTHLNRKNPDYEVDTDKATQTQEHCVTALGIVVMITLTAGLIHLSIA